MRPRRRQWGPLCVVCLHRGEPDLMSLYLDFVQIDFHSLRSSNTRDLRLFERSLAPPSSISRVVAPRCLSAGGPLSPLPGVPWSRFQLRQEPGDRAGWGHIKLLIGLVFFSARLRCCLSRDAGDTGVAVTLVALICPAFS